MVEINHTTYNLARTNMFLHNINYSKFNIVYWVIRQANPQFKDESPSMLLSQSSLLHSVDWLR